MTNIIKRVYLKPKYLDSNIEQHLLNTLIKTAVGTCSQEDGHILSISRIVEILDNEDTIFTVKFEAETLKPREGCKVKGTVCMIYKDGLFIDIVPGQQLLIPAITLKNYKFNPINTTYESDDDVISIGNEVNAVITAAKYNNKSFSCVGSLA